MGEHRYGNHTYVSDEAGIKVIFSERKPETLLKFFPLNEYSLKAISEEYLYAAHPWQFNDVYDHFDPKGDSVISREEQMRFFLYNGVVSLSHPSNLLNPLMWAHYTDYSGFVVEYDIKSFYKDAFGPFLMNYLPYRPSSKDRESIENEPSLLRVLCWVLLKSKVWEYEKEWRYLFLNKTGAAFKPPAFLEVDDECFDERRLPIRKSGIRQVVLGQKFLLHELNRTECIGDKLCVSFKDQLKAQLIRFVVENEIPCSILAFADTSAFEFEKMPVSISSTENSYVFEKLTE